jgi:hypothetical protein
MMLVLLLFAVFLADAPGAAQSQQPSSSGQPPSSSEDAAPRRDDTTTDGTLPVSLDRIREGLLHAPARPLLSTIDRPPDFTVQIEERRTIEEILSTILSPEDLKAGPVPAGGLYAHEQQQRLFNPVDNPLRQPYAAFSNGELLTIAIENLMVKYLGGRLADAVTSAERARAEKAARADLSRAIAEYCTAHPEKRDSLPICEEVSR